MSDDDTSDYESLGRIGYDAYGDEADWRNYEGKPMPMWEELPEHIRRKWRVAARAISQAFWPGGN